MLSKVCWCARHFCTLVCLAHWQAGLLACKLTEHGGTFVSKVNWWSSILTCMPLSWDFEIDYRLCKINQVISWAIFETLKQLLRAFICVSPSSVDFDAHVKALVHFLELQLGKVLCNQKLIQYFFWDSVRCR